MRAGDYVGRDGYYRPNTVEAMLVCAVEPKAEGRIVPTATLMADLCQRLLELERKVVTS